MLKIYDYLNEKLVTLATYVFLEQEEKVNYPITVVFWRGEKWYIEIKNEINFYAKELKKMIKEFKKQK